MLAQHNTQVLPDFRVRRTFNGSSSRARTVSALNIVCKEHRGNWHSSNRKANTRPFTKSVSWRGFGYQQRTALEIEELVGVELPRARKAVVKLRNMWNLRVGCHRRESEPTTPPDHVPRRNKSPRGVRGSTKKKEETTQNS